MGKTIKKKDYTEKKLYKKSTIYYIYKKLQEKTPCRRKDYIKNRVRL